MTQPTRPYVLINMAVTADGKIASANRAITSFGSRHDHSHLLQLRATVDAVMTGAGTLNAQPNITLGLHRKSQRAPLRILVSGRGRANLRARLFAEPGAPLIVLTTCQLPPARRAALEVGQARRARQRFAEHFHTFRVWAQTLTGPQLRRSDLSAL